MTSLSTSRYWANWDPTTIPGQVIRRDTRIYWANHTTGCSGRCVGTFIGENPGSAESIFGLSFHGYSPGSAGGSGDDTLRLISDAWKLAVSVGTCSLPANDDFIEVLNTYYFCNSASGAAIVAWRAAGGGALYSPAPSRTARFILLGWGVEHTASPEAITCAGLLRGHPRVIVPASSGAVSVHAGSTLAHGVTPGPVAPSFILRKSKTLKLPYLTNVAQEFR
jgi:hypothetical protein